MTNWVTKSCAGILGSSHPATSALSMTLWLGLPLVAATVEELSAVDRRSRDLQFNPDRHLDEPLSEEIRTLIRAKQEAIASSLASRHERVERYRAIRRLNEALQPWVSDLRDDLVESRARLKNRLKSNRVAESRILFCAPFQGAAATSPHKCRAREVGLGQQGPTAIRRFRAEIARYSAFLSRFQ